MTEQAREPLRLTGIKPTGAPHLGNYLAAIRPAIQAAPKNAYFFIADYHALTTLKDPEALSRLSLELAATWIALGIDPEKHCFYRQSQVPEIFELNWILSCFAPKGLLNRGHAYKALVEENESLGRDSEQNINMGIYSYPVLMAADILAFDATEVPVGQDQKQHVEMARDIAQAVNKHFPETLVLPEPSIPEAVKVIPGLDGRKMSKNYDNTIPLFLEQGALRKKIMKIKTDSTPVEDPKDPESCPVFGLFNCFATPEASSAMKASYQSGGEGYGHYKTQLFEAIDSHLAPFRTEYQALLSDSPHLESVLAEGAKKAREKAAQTLSRVKKAIGL